MAVATRAPEIAFWPSSSDLDRKLVSSATESAASIVLLTPIDRDEPVCDHSNNSRVDQTRSGSCMNARRSRMQIGDLWRIMRCYGDAGAAWASL
jgi:hypothetical protein